MAAVAFPAVGLAYDHINGVISIPLAHAFNTYFSAMGIPNAANGVRDYPIHLLQMLHFSLSRRNPNNIAELDNLFYGAMGIDELSIFQSIQVAVTAGFTHGVVATGNHVLDGYQIVRAAQVWAQAHTSQLNPVLAAGFYNLPGMPGRALRLALRCLTQCWKSLIQATLGLWQRLLDWEVMFIRLLLVPMEVGYLWFSTL